LKAELTELDGRPGPEVLLERFGEIVPGETEARVVEIYGLRGGYLKRMFAHKLSEAVPREQLEATADFKILAAGKGARKLQVGPVAVKGYNAGNAADVDGERPAYFRFVWPWDSKKPQTYALQGDAWMPTGK
jgi:hypothetical protein